MSEKKKMEELVENLEEIQKRSLTELKESLAIERALGDFAEKHNAEYFCAILLPDDETGRSRHSVFKFGEAGKAIAHAVRDLPQFTV